MNDSSNNELRQRLIQDFGDKEFRESYAEGFQHTWISAQLSRIRQQRGLTQRDLAELVGTKQPGIARMEREDYGKWNISTLSKCAAALDCWLMVSLESYGALLDKVTGFTSPEFLDRPAFAKDPDIHSAYREWPALSQPGPTGEMSRKVAKWLDTKSNLRDLKGWLMGEALPPVGDEIAPSQWLAETLRLCPAGPSEIAASRVSRLLEESAASGELFSARRDFGIEILSLAAAWPHPRSFSSPLGLAWERSAGRIPDSLRHPLRRILVEAIKVNQDSDTFENIWESFVNKGWSTQPEHELSLQAGFDGLIRIPSAPNIHKVIEGCEWTPTEKATGDEVSRTLTGVLRATLKLVPAKDRVKYNELIGKESQSRKVNDIALKALLNVAPPQSKNSSYAAQKFYRASFGHVA